MFEEIEGAGGRQELNPEHLIFSANGQLYTTSGEPSDLTFRYTYCTVGTKCPSHTPGIYTECAIKTSLGIVDQKKLHL